MVVEISLRVELFITDGKKRRYKTEEIKRLVKSRTSVVFFSVRRRSETTKSSLERERTNSTMD